MSTSTKKERKSFQKMSSNCLSGSLAKWMGYKVGLSEFSVQSTPGKPQRNPTNWCENSSGFARLNKHSFSDMSRHSPLEIFHCLCDCGWRLFSSELSRSTAQSFNPRILPGRLWVVYPDRFGSYHVGQGMSSEGWIWRWELREKIRWSLGSVSLVTSLL